MKRGGLTASGGFGPIRPSPSPIFVWVVSTDMGAAEATLAATEAEIYSLASSGLMRQFASYRDAERRQSGRG